MVIIPIHTKPLQPTIVSDLPCSLIIKPTELCNFKCTFCSSTDISEDKAKTLDLQLVFDFLTHYPNTTTIIVNGGDPLMVPPSYYWDILDFLDTHNMPATLSFTTNLWAFFKKPEMWSELFKHPRVGVTTSFNYGDTRRITKTRVYTEDVFWQVSDMFLEHVGYRPDFISVITEENEDTAIDNVLLAKQMDVECKLNYAMASGEQGQPYQLSKIYNIYVQLYKQGLTQWEYNTKQMIQRMTGQTTTCPQSRTCDTYIRALNPGGDYYTCGSFGDDRTHAISYTGEIYEGKHFTPLNDDPSLLSLKNECLSCPMFSICNGCRKTVKDMKDSGIVESHCTLMKSIAPDIIAAGKENS